MALHVLHDCFCSILSRNMGVVCKTVVAVSVLTSKEEPSLRPPHCHPFDLGETDWPPRVAPKGQWEMKPIACLNCQWVRDVFAKEKTELFHNLHLCDLCMLRLDPPGYIASHVEGQNLGARKVLRVVKIDAPGEVFVDSLDWQPSNGKRLCVTPKIAIELQIYLSVVSHAHFIDGRQLVGREWRVKGDGSWGVPMLHHAKWQG
mmetsp:Transcript_24836/g.41185  ORF Transcript_24836/g.41185 Transcript_24836/m.41185 type:complete len:203 (-) Transcript_24836:211-819(-)